MTANIGTTSDPRPGWCVACGAASVTHGDGPHRDDSRINYKEAPADAARWLDTLGDPCAADGRVMHKHAGALTKHVRDSTIMPLIERLRRGADRVSP